MGVLDEIDQMAGCALFHFQLCRRLIFADEMDAGGLAASPAFDARRHAPGFCPPV